MATAFALTAFAQTTNRQPQRPATTKIQCVGAAVNARETAIDTAMTAYTSSLTSAYHGKSNGFGNSISIFQQDQPLRAQLKQLGLLSTLQQRQPEDMEARQETQLGQHIEQQQ